MSDSTEEKEETSESAERFFHACSIGDEEEAQKWVQRTCDVDFRNTLSETGLIIAARQGSINIVRLLLDSGADHDVVDSWGYNALMKAAARGHTAIFRLLLKKSNSLFCNTFLGKLTALTEAAAFGRTEIIKLCLEHDKLVINSPVELSGMTPLMLAVLGGHFHAVEILLENGANLTLRNSYSRSAQEIAVNIGDENIIKLVDSYSGGSTRILPEIVISCEDKDTEDNSNLRNTLTLTPTSRLPIRNNERQICLNSIVRHIKR